MSFLNVATNLSCGLKNGIIATNVHFDFLFRMTATYKGILCSGDMPVARNLSEKRRTANQIICSNLAAKIHFKNKFTVFPKAKNIDSSFV